jgi:hypothetical protein
MIGRRRAGRSATLTGARCGAGLDGTDDRPEARSRADWIWRAARITFFLRCAAEYALC